MKESKIEGIRMEYGDGCGIKMINCVLLKIEESEFDWCEGGDGNGGGIYV
jgi:hypothetical protein